MTANGNEAKVIDDKYVCDLAMKIVYLNDSGSKALKSKRLHSNGVRALKYSEN